MITVTVTDYGDSYLITDYGDSYRIVITVTVTELPSGQPLNQHPPNRADQGKRRHHHCPPFELLAPRDPRHAADELRLLELIETFETGHSRTYSASAPRISRSCSLMIRAN